MTLNAVSFDPCDFWTHDPGYESESITFVSHLMMTVSFYSRIISIVLFVTHPLALGEVGGHVSYVSASKDLYASSMQIKILWENDILLVKLLEAIREKWKSSPKSFDM